MKRFLFSAAALALLLAGCSKDNVVDSTARVIKASDFYGTIAEQSRTQLDTESGYAAWIEGEKLSIFNLSDHNLQYEVKNVTNSGLNADFGYTENYIEGSGAELDKNYALYPWHEQTTICGTTLSTHIPQVQSYNPQSNLQHVIMVGSSTSQSLSFTIPTSVFRFKVSKENNPNKFILKKITLSSASQTIAGTVNIDMSADYPVAIADSSADDASKSITLDLGEGVVLSTTEQHLYITLPATVFPENDVTISYLVSIQGKERQINIAKEASITAEVAHIHSTSIKVTSDDFNGSTAYPATGGELVGSLTLTSALNLEQPLSVPAGESATLNLNDHNITTAQALYQSGVVSAAVCVKEGATLTITGEGTIDASAYEDYAVEVRGGDMVIKSGTFVGSVTAVYAVSGNITIEGGEFKVAPSDYGATYLLNLKDNSGATISVKGGKFYGFDPANNAAENPKVNFVADGYISVETSEGVWEVLPATQSVTVNSAAALCDVLTAGGSAVVTENITLDADNAITVPQGSNASLTINGGVTVTIPATSNIDLIKNYGTMTLNGEGTIAAGNDVNSRRCIYNYGEMTIDGLKFVQSYNENGAAINNEGKMTIKNTYVEAKYYALWNSGSEAEMVIENGTFISTNTSTTTPCYAVSNSSGAELTILDGYFEGTHGVIGCISSSKAALHGGKYLCKSTYSHGSDWTLYASSNAAIVYNAEKCTLTNDYSAQNNICQNGGTITAMATDQQGVNNALSNGGYVVLADDITTQSSIKVNNGVFDGNGNDVTADYVSSYSNPILLTTGGEIKNLTTFGGWYSIATDNLVADLYIDNVVTKDTGYGINLRDSNAEYQLFASNSQFYGWSSWTGLTLATFTNCTFGLGVYWVDRDYADVYDRLIKPYVNTVFEKCEFNKGHYIDLSSFSGTEVVFRECTVNGQPLTKEMFKNATESASGNQTIDELGDKMLWYEENTSNSAFAAITVE